ncbi:MAG: pseudouridine synthase, partial [Pseudomonadota bacterium]|nr:pseudouridine synthase [Pseudomonadota bacterium]
MALVSDRGDLRRGVARHPGEGKHAVTHYRVVERFASVATLVACWLETGRTHQIRVHLASRGHPVAGDDKYGDFDLNRVLQKHGLKRMFLHAWRLQFDHPASAERTELIAPLPPELRKFADHAPAATAPL